MLSFRAGYFSNQTPYSNIYVLTYIYMVKVFPFISRGDHLGAAPPWRRDVYGRIHNGGQETSVRSDVTNVKAPSG